MVRTLWRFWRHIILFVQRRENGKPIALEAPRRPPPMDDRFGYCAEVKPASARNPTPIERTAEDAQTEPTPPPGTGEGAKTEPAAPAERIAEATPSANLTPHLGPQWLNRLTAKVPEISRGSIEALDRKGQAVVKETFDEYEARDRDYKRIEPSGQYRFKDDVLDQLQNYFKIMKRFKRRHREAYDYFARVGMNLVPDRHGFLKEESGFGNNGFRILDPWFVSTLPMRGGIATGVNKDTVATEEKSLRWFEALDAKAKAKAIAEEKDGVTHPRFIYFNRLMKTGAVDIQLPPEDAVALYEMQVLYEIFSFGRKQDVRRSGGTGALAIAVHTDGTLTALRMRRSERFVIHHNKRRRPGEPTSTFLRREWAIPGWLDDYAKKRKHSPEEEACRWFLQIVESYRALNSSMIRVSIEKDGVVAAINVDIARTPYFFSDRDPVVVEGVKKRIFHIVRPHARTDGSTVKLHFRGLRDFEWNDFKVRITVPGRDHSDWTHFSEASFMEGSEADKTLTDGIDSKELAELIRQNIQTGWLPSPETMRELPQLREAS